MRFILILTIAIFIWAFWVVNSHPKGAVVSWDEGFHGGAALFISESLRDHFAFQKYSYILNDFKNGIIWYLPLWWALAGLAGAVFNPSVEIYRLVTLTFSILSIVLVSFFAKMINGNKAGFITASALVTVPIFIVYSHLIMEEIPLLFSTSLALIFFFRFLTKPKLENIDLLITLIFFAIGVCTKITAILLIFGVIFSFGILLFLFHKNSEAYKRFYSRWTIYFLISALFTFTSFRLFTKTFLNADLLEFYLGQTKQLTGQEGNIFFVLIKTLIDNFAFYSRDFSHMLPLTTLWFGSLIAFVILKRFLLSYYLLTWVCVSYLVFSSVRPQAAQYILPIFTPLSLAVGLFWGEFLKYRGKFFSDLLFTFLIFLIVGLGLIYLDKTETIVWRNTKTFQADAAALVAKKAAAGDRVITTGDGTRLLVRLYGFNKKLQTINGAAPFCYEFLQDSVEWAILDNGPQSPIKLNELKTQNWVVVAKFPTSVEDTIVLRNINKTNDVDLENEDFINTRCVRLFALGKNEINFFITALAEDIKGDLKISLKINPLKSFKSLVISQEDLKKYNGQEKIYNFDFEQVQLNKQIYIYFEIPKNLRIKVRKIQIKKING